MPSTSCVDALHGIVSFFCYFVPKPLAEVVKNTGIEQTQCQCSLLRSFLIAAIHFLCRQDQDFLALIKA